MVIFKYRTLRETSCLAARQESGQMSTESCLTGTGTWRTRIAACGALATMALFAPAALAAAPEQGPPFVLQQVAPGVYVAIDQGARAGANAGFVIGDDSVAVLGKFQNPQAAGRLRAEIRQPTPLPGRVRVNPHAHPHQVPRDH